VPPSSSAPAEPPPPTPEAIGAPDGGDGATPRRRGGRAHGEGQAPPRRGGGGGKRRGGDDERMPDDLPDRIRENAPSPEAAERALVRRKPRIGDTLPAPPPATPPAGDDGDDGERGGANRRRRRRGGRGRGGGGDAAPRRREGAGGPSRSSRPSAPAQAEAPDEQGRGRRQGRERKGRPVGRYLMVVHSQPDATQIAVLEGRALIEHYVSRPQDDTTQIHGNIYLGRVQNVLPGMEAAFVDIGTPKNAVLYRGDVQFDPEDIEQGGDARIEHILKARQSIVCQVTKNPIGAKGARLTQEVSLPGRFVVLIPRSSTYGISKRLADDERKRLRSVLDKVKPAAHGLIVRTAAEGATREELERDVGRLLSQWERIEAAAAQAHAPALLYREPDMAVRVIREEFNSSYRGVVIDDRELFEEVRDYVASITPELADRVEHHDPDTAALPLFEEHRVHEQLHKALDRKVWLPSGGSLIIERTEALTVIDVNTGKNVGRSSLEETVYRNNLEAAEEVARQLRLRDIGGIIVIDFIDMEVKKNRDDVIRVFREALARDKTRTQVFDISELGLVEMTRKRIGEGLIESMSRSCPTCDGRGLVFEQELLGDD
jgi:ribonuclease E